MWNGHKRLLWSLCFCQWSRQSEGPKCDVSPYPLETCGRNQHVTFRCQTQSNLTPCDSLNAKTPSPSETCICLDRCYCTHANVSGRNHCVCLAYFFVLFRAAPFQPCSSQQNAHVHSHFCYWAPLNHSRLLGLVQRDTCPHRMSVWSLSLWITCLCYFYLYGQSCFHHLFSIFICPERRTTFPSTADLE